MQDLNALRDDLMELKPTLFAGVPRVFEKVHEGKIINIMRKSTVSCFSSTKLSQAHLCFRYQESS